MYDDMLLVDVAGADEFWDHVERELLHAESDLLYKHVQTAEEALMGHFRDDFPQVIRYRGASAELDNRDHFLELGSKALERLRPLIAGRQLTPEFAQQWGILTFCHGFIASHIADDSDPLANRRGGQNAKKKRSRDAQRKWLSHLILPLLQKGIDRHSAERFAYEKIVKIIKNREYNEKFDENWFLVMIKKGGLTSTYFEKQLYPGKMRQLIDNAALEIPAIPDIT